MLLHRAKIHVHLIIPAMNSDKSITEHTVIVKNEWDIYCIKDIV